MKHKYNNKIVALLRCPVNRKHRLSRDERGFRCNLCHKLYVSKYVNDIEIPNFLIEKNYWVRGYRGLSSRFIGAFQKRTPVDRYSGPGKWILDVGCGDNARGNINLDCYIPSPIPENFILANAEHLPFADKNVDVILSYYNIEHLINPAFFIRSVYSIATKKITIVTDNSEWIGDVFFRVVGSGRIYHDEHTYKWSREYMANLIKRLGIKKAKISALNLSSTSLVRFVSILGKIPRMGIFFYRDLMIEILI